jgi:hypothetical protein
MPNSAPPPPCNRPRRVRRCPHCHYPRCYASGYRGLELLLALVLLRPFRCLDCKRRIWRFAFSGRLR